MASMTEFTDWMDLQSLCACQNGEKTQKKVNTTAQKLGRYIYIKKNYVNQETVTMTVEKMSYARFWSF